MATPRVAWGIDIGNRALKAVKLVRAGEGVRIDDFDVIEHENVLSNAGDNREVLIQTALAVFQGKHSLKGMPAAVGVSGQASFARFIKLPPVEEKKIPEIVKFEAIQQIPFPLDEVEWSYQLFRDEASPDVEVGIFAMRRELVNQHLAYFTQSGVNVQAVQMNPLAVYNALKFDGRLTGTTMIVDLGAENADLIIAEGEGVWMRSIPIGGNHFTEALVRDFKLRFERAEELKRTTATSPHGRRILQAMRPVFADLVSEMQRSIGFYSSTHRDSRIARVIVLGGTFKLPGLQKYLQQNLGLEVVKLDGLGTEPPADAKIAAAVSENVLSAAGAYGLALQAIGEARITSSLLPQAIRTERMWRDKTKWFAAAAACVVAGAAIPYGLSQVERGMFAQQSGVQADVDRVLSEGTRLSGQWKTSQDAGVDDRKKIAEAATLAEHRDMWPGLIAELKAVIPEPPPHSATRPATEPAVPPAAAAGVPDAAAAGGAAATRPAAQKPTARPASKERGDRTDVHLEDLETQYVPLLADAVLKNDKGEFVLPDPTFNLRAGRRDLQSLAGQRTRRTIGGVGAGAGPYGGGSPFGGGGTPIGMGEGMPAPAAPSGEGAAAGGTALPTDPNDPNQKHGFLLTLHLTTPNAKGYEHVRSTVIAALRKREADRQAYALAEAQKPGAVPPKLPFSVARISIPTARRIRDDADRQKALAQRVREARARRLQTQLNALPVDVGGTRTNMNLREGTPVPGPVGVPTPGLTIPGVGTQTADEMEEVARLLVDPATGEDIRGDWELTVLLAVVLDPKPPAPPPEGAPAAPVAAANGG